MTPATPPSAQSEFAHAAPSRSSLWKRIFRIVRWTTYAFAFATLILLLHKAPPPIVETSPQAAARAEEKFEQVEKAVANGQPATLRLDETELNSYLASHLDLAGKDEPKPALSGEIGSLPIPQSTLESAVQRLMDSPENREKLKLPSEISDLRIQNGEVVASYK